MKKNEYVAPEMEVVEIETERFIAASDNGTLIPDIDDDHEAGEGDF